MFSQILLIEAFCTVNTDAGYPAILTFRVILRTDYLRGRGLDSPPLLGLDSQYVAVSASFAVWQIVGYGGCVGCEGLLWGGGYPYNMA